jgi:YkoY family integral membrane protein
LIMIGAAAYLLRSTLLKLIGGIYLLWVGGKYFFVKHSRPVPAAVNAKPASFWRIVAQIEVTDAAFAADSILAAVALVGSPPRGTPAGDTHPKLWVIVVGGMLGVVVMRFAAAGVTKIIDRFGGLERSAYLLVILIGAKMLVEWASCDAKGQPRIDFQNPDAAAFWIFWLLMAACLASGFLGKMNRPTSNC